MRHVARFCATAAGSIALVTLRLAIWPVAIGIVTIGMAALAIIARATFSKRPAPMMRLRAFIREIRGIR